MIDMKYCQGCHDNFYNPDCWSRKSGKIVWRIPVGLMENPPYKDKKKKRVASCWHDSRSGSGKTIMVKAESLTPDGYWQPMTF